MLRLVGCSLGLLLFVLQLAAQGPAAGPDTIVFVNGDKLVGHFVSSSGASVKFKSDVLGDITVDWSKVKELHTASKVAVIRKGVEIHKHTDTSTIPQGTLSMENQNIQVASQTIPVAEASVIVDQ